MTLEGEHHSLKNDPQDHFLYAHARPKAASKRPI